MSINQDQIEEIDAQRATQLPTRRATVEAMEEILYQPLPVLDHGFIRVIDYMGDDAAIVQAARVSYGKGTKKVSNDQGLINYLMRNRHTSPFEMCEIKLHVKLPIFIARQWIRHRTANVNEYSARYSVLDDGNYLPEPKNLAAQSTANRQGRGEAVSEAEAEAILTRIKANNEASRADYEWLLGGDETHPGITRELARMVLPLNAYTQWYWKIDLHNLLHFVGLRADSHAQYEIRAYAELLQQILEKWVPLTAAAFRNYRQEGLDLSAQGLGVIKRMLAGEKIEQTDSGLSAREWQEIMARLDL